MDEVFLKVLKQRIDNGEMSIEYLPEPIRAEVQALIDAENNSTGGQTNAD